jgi:hypothetical protein
MLLNTYTGNFHGSLSHRDNATSLFGKKVGKKGTSDNIILERDGVVWVAFDHKQLAKSALGSNDRIKEHLKDLNISSLLDELNEYNHLQDGWDGAGSIRPTPRSIEAARKFIDSVEASYVAPELSLAYDGEISVFWRETKLYVDVSFRANGKTSLFAKSGTRIVKHYIDNPRMSDLPLFIREDLCA